jgi:CRISPR-associated protein Cas1
MTTLYLTEQYSFVRKDGETLVVQIPADKARGTPKRTVRLPLLKVEQVVVYGDITISTAALLALLEQQAEVCFLSYHGQFKGRLSNGFTKNGGLRIAQHRRAVANNAHQALLAAKAFVAGKLANMRTLLLRANRKLDDEEVKQAIKRMAGLIEQIERLESDGLPPPDPSKPQANSAWGRLLGLEGSGSACYFGVFGKLLKHDLGFTKRTRRPPTDPVNAMLSFGYTLLTNQVAAAVNLVGLDPYVGFLHGSKYGKPAVALDLVEEFRPIVVDSVVLTLVNTGAIKRTDFVETMGAFQLTEAGRKTFLQKYEERLNTTIQHPTFGYQVTYRKAIEVQARLLAKWLTGEVPAYIPFVVR